MTGEQVNILKIARRDYQRICGRNGGALGQSDFERGAWQAYDRLLPIIEAQERRIGELATAAYHAHLDMCSRCKYQPFNPCQTGWRLLREGAVVARGDDRT